MFSPPVLRPRVHPLFVVAASIAALGIAYIATSMSSQQGSGDAAVAGVQYQRPADPSAERGREPAFSGEVSGLAPGLVVPLPVRVRNDNPFDITVTALTVVASSVTGCAANMLQVRPYDGPQLVVLARSSAIRSIDITLRSDAPDSCKNVSFPLIYSGTAVKS